MGRSVNYLGHALHVAYLDTSDINEDLDFLWQDMKEEIASELKFYYPSLSDCKKWGNNETQIILESIFCEIGISEYCGLTSISIRIKESDYPYLQSLAERWINQVWPGMVKKVFSRYELLNKLGTFSNGESIFKKSC